MAALRILHVAPYFEQAWAYGGIPRVVSAQAHALAAAGHRVTVATTDARDSTSRTTPVGRRGSSRLAPRAERTADGVDLVVFPNLSNAAAYRWQFYTPLGFAGWLRAHAGEFDAAHLHACRNLLTARGATLLRRAGVPFVVQPNGTARRIERRLAAKVVFDAVFGNALLTHAARIIAVSGCERRQLQELLSPGAEAPGLHQYADAGLHEHEEAGRHQHEAPGLRGQERESKIQLVPNPLAPLPSCCLPERGRFRERLGLTNAPLLMYFGTLSPRKQPDMLARGAAALGRSDVQLVFAGNDMGEERTVRRLVRRLGLERRTRFTGLLAGPARYAALADADLLVYPSYGEVFGLVPLEALQTGTPVIVSNDSGCGEIVDGLGGGLLVTPGNPALLASAIETILRDLPRWRAAAAQAGAEAARRFHPDAVAGRLEAVYREAISRPGRA
jgi:glycosyltransferase involved in cell wall biosynthesis